MTKDDPFGLENDPSRTVIRPARAGRPSATARIGSDPTPSVAVQPLRMRQARATDNRLVAAYSVLLGLAPELASAAPPENPETLRARLHDNLVYSRDGAVSSGATMAQADQGAWFVAALIDDIVLNTPWGRACGWPNQPLVTQMSGEVDAGERFFVRLDELTRYPDRDPELLELAYLTLTLGFRGRRRLEGQSGEAAVTQLRAQIARLLGRDDDAALSPRWRGIEAPEEKRRFVVPLWCVALLAAAFLTGLWLFLQNQLANRGDTLYALIDSLPPERPAQIFRPSTEIADTPSGTTVEPFVFELFPEFQAAAPPERAAALSGRETSGLTVIELQSSNPEVFRPASADINSEFGLLLASIAQVVNDNAELIAGITVVGHTDSVPTGRNGRFKSNQALSDARAERVARVLVAAGIDAAIVSSRGMADSEPIADNGTREGRARNRRVEIVIEKKV